MSPCVYFRRWTMCALDFYVEDMNVKYLCMSSSCQFFGALVRRHEVMTNLRRYTLMHIVATRVNPLSQCSTSWSFKE